MLLFEIIHTSVITVQKVTEILNKLHFCTCLVFSAGTTVRLRKETWTRNLKRFQVICAAYVDELRILTGSRKRKQQGCRLTGAARK